jgi:hypothetical protein|tara:strand:- start:780 stop:1067 length:288 start_codon:yes stop_codon:yes gene_type:complete
LEELLMHWLLRLLGLEWNGASMPFWGDNIVLGQGLSMLLRSVSAMESGLTLFAYPLKGPQRFGVVSFDEAGNGLTLEEKTFLASLHSCDYRSLFS